PVPMRNLELKARYPDLERGEAIAQSIGAEFGCAVHQRDTYYNAPTGRLKLREQERRFHDGISPGSSELIYLLLAAQRVLRGSRLERGAGRLFRRRERRREGRTRQSVGQAGPHRQGDRAAGV